MSGGSSAGDPDTPSVVTTGMSVHAAGSAAGCRSRPGAEVDPLYPPARPPTALVASGCSSIPAETGKRLLPPVEAQATDLTVSTKTISTRDAAAAESVSASTPESETRLSTQGMRKLNVGCRVVPPLLISPPIRRLQIVEDSPLRKLIPSIDASAVLQLPLTGRFV